MSSGPPLPHPEKPLSVIAVDLTGDHAVTCAAAILQFEDGWELRSPARPLNTDEQIIALANSYDVVALDGPRRPPKGFERFMERGETPPEGVARSRACEREHTRRVCPIFYSSPVATRGVQQWMARSWKLFEEMDHDPIEIYPMGAFVALLNGTEKRKPHHLPPKGSRAGQKRRVEILKSLGLSVGAFATTPQGTEKAHDRIDAAVGAVVAACYAIGRAVELGDAADGTVVLPGISLPALRQ
ncbi:MAG: DUF429 domain-containing protein [Myxococcota bacterium]